MIGTFLVFAFVLGSLKTLYEFRHVPWIGEWLSLITAVILVYPAALHVLKKRLPVKFFERNLREIFYSLKIFLITALIIFPPFLLAAHLYQTQVFGLHLEAYRFFLKGSMVLFQIFMVALPEEFFFRGYLQTRLKTKFSKTFRPFGLEALRVPTAVPLTCLIFAASHSFITFQWWHFAIFFPSLVFGWLREKTGGLIAPILFHASCNVLVAILGRVYHL